MKIITFAHYMRMQSHWLLLVAHIKQTTVTADFVMAHAGEFRRKVKQKGYVIR